MKIYNVFFMIKWLEIFYCTKKIIIGWWRQWQGNGLFEDLDALWFLSPESVIIFVLLPTRSTVDQYAAASVPSDPQTEPYIIICDYFSFIFITIMSLL